MSSLWGYLYTDEILLSYLFFRLNSASYLSLSLYLSPYGEMIIFVALVIFVAPHWPTKLQYVHVFLVLGRSGLDTAFQVQPH